MGVGVRYMGTKRQLAPAVAEVLCSAQQGVVLDLFSGMCAVGTEVGERRQIWNNDAQVFASTVAEAFFTSQDLLPSLSCTIELLFNYYEQNLFALQEKYVSHLAEELKVIESGQINRLLAYLNKHANECLTEERIQERAELSTARDTFPYRLFSITYADGYFGMQQSIEIDSIVYAVDQNFKREDISHDQRNWLLIALGQAMLRVANTTGHFAQYLQLKEGNLAFYLSQRKKSVWAEFVSCISDNCPIGGARWRRRNKVFNEDSVDLLVSLRTRSVQPSAIYADPPYTDDQYSRYYHVYESLIKYDYPQIASKGRYRPDRFRSGFSLRGQVAAAFESLVNNAAAIGADLIVSYPSSGLLHEIGETPERFLRRHYNKIEVSYTIEHEHSTLGASKGAAKSPVTEIIYWARQ
jgi:adenine-specific DNA-methyltransferase